MGAGDDRETRVYFYGDYVNSPFEPVIVSDMACTSCHGPEGIDVHGGYYQASDGGEPCLVCHGSERETDEGIEEVPSLAAVTHGFHSSIWVEDEEEGPIHITYPTYMNNCSVCHDDDDTLMAANMMPVNDQACFSCHGSTETMFEEDDPLAGLHAGITGGCESCHADGGPASDYQTVTDVHNGLTLSLIHI